MYNRHTCTTCVRVQSISLKKYHACTMSSNDPDTLQFLILVTLQLMMKRLAVLKHSCVINDSKGNTP